MKRARRGEGRTAEKVRGMLEAMGMDFRFFVFATGYWTRADVYRWEAFGTSRGTGAFASVPAGMNVSVAGWEPMTISARGFDLSYNARDTLGHFETSPTSAARGAGEGKEQP